MRSPLGWISSIGTWLSLLPMAPAAAHEGHAHVFSGVPLWQMAVGAGLAVAIYFGLVAWRKRLKGRSNKR
jgi:hypothetical protein